MSARTEEASLRSDQSISDARTSMVGVGLCTAGVLLLVMTNGPAGEDVPACVSRPTATLSHRATELELRA